jgi:DNA-binding response OmpR family regulator
MMTQRHDTAGGQILIVEDDESIGKLLCDVFEEAGYRAMHALTGAEAKSVVEQSRIDLILLDLRLPDTDGLILCADLHSRAQVPIIVVSATNEKRDALLAFKLGADDFVAKPFDVDHLLARVEAALRRAPSPRAAQLAGGETRAGAIAPRVAAEDPRVRRCGGLVMDHARRRVAVGGQAVAVTATEYRILECLLERQDEVVTREELALQVWGYQDAGIGRSIDVHMRRLRIKLDGGADAPQITAVRGFGYRLHAAEVALAA